MYGVSNFRPQAALQQLLQYCHYLGGAYIVWLLKLGRYIIDYTECTYTQQYDLYEKSFSKYVPLT